MNNANYLPPIADSLQQLTANYDALLCDIWGVVHNGRTAHPKAIEALRNFKKSSGYVLLITNAPRRHTSVRSQLEKLGVNQDHYDDIITSGDVTFRLIEERSKLKFFHLGPQRDRDLFARYEQNCVNLDQAEYVLCTGLFDDESEGPDDYRDMLSKIKQMNLDFVCANPDLKVERGDKLIYCAGILAAEYEKLGGRVLIAGKPHAPIYNEALNRLKQLRTQKFNKERVLAIGDGFPTDILGAHNAQLDCLLILGGLPARELAERGDGYNLVIEKLGAMNARPVAMMNRLSW